MLAAVLNLPPRENPIFWSIPPDPVSLLRARLQQAQVECVVKEMGPDGEIPLFSKDSIAVGWELPMDLRTALDQASVRWISFRSAPWVMSHTLIECRTSFPWAGEPWESSYQVAFPRRVSNVTLMKDAILLLPDFPERGQSVVPWKEQMRKQIASLQSRYSMVVSAGRLGTIKDEEAWLHFLGVQIKHEKSVETLFRSTDIKAFAGTDPLVTVFAAAYGKPAVCLTDYVPAPVVPARLLGAQSFWKDLFRSAAEVLCH
jgi:hypothetical protein